MDIRSWCTWRIWQHIGVCRTHLVAAEKVEQKKLDNYSSHTMTANIWAKRDSKVGYVIQQTLEGFPHPCIGKMHSISKLYKPLGQNAWSLHHTGTIRTPDWYQVAISHPRVLGWLEAGYCFSHYLPPFPETGRTNRKFGNNAHIHFSLTLTPSHLNQLYKNHIKFKQTENACVSIHAYMYQC